MTDILKQIVATKKQEVEAAKKATPLHVLQDQCTDLPPTHSMRQSILSHKGGIISEFKRRSPSKNWIKRDARVEDIIPAYEAAGAAGISILTDQTYFGGTLHDLIKARSLTSLPLLRKDFVIDAYQLFEARVAGADACLLIAAAIGDQKCHELAEVAHTLNLEVILEVHCAEELTAYSEHVDIIGVNNRNLKLFKTDTSISEDLFAQLPPQALPISESGLLDNKVAIRLQQMGYRGFLVGEAFMKTEKPGEALQQYIEPLKEVSNTF